MKRLFLALLAIGFASQLGFANPVWAEDIPSHDEAFAFDTRSAGPLPANPPRSPDGRAIVARQEVRIDGAPWLQLLFAEANLGATGAIRIRSLEDGDTQEMGAAELREWSNESAFFNGEAVEISLLSSPAESGVYFRTESVRVGDVPEEPIEVNRVCGARDERQFSTDRRVARGAPQGCTFWLVPNGVLLTAGHCLANPERVGIVEFNTPRSRPDKVIVRSAVRDQYPVLRGSLMSRNDGSGQDWGVVAVGRNTTTGMTALQAQGAAFAISRSTNPGAVRITGYGTADGDRNQAQQTSTGPYMGQRVGQGTRVTHVYRVDTTGGNSGSPIIAPDAVSAIGIHTAGGCTADGGANVGTSFNNADLMNAIQQVGAAFPSANPGR